MDEKIINIEVKAKELLGKIQSAINTYTTLVNSGTETEGLGHNIITHLEKIEQILMSVDTEKHTKELITREVNHLNDLENYITKIENASKKKISFEVDEKLIEKLEAIVLRDIDEVIERETKLHKTLFSKK